MTSNIRKIYCHDSLLVGTFLANNEINTITLEAIIRLKDLSNRLPSVSLGYKRIKVLRDAVDLCITKIALNYGLYFKESKKLALISGAGISGLAASFELRARGFNVVIVEKRRSFSRSNIINLHLETQVFLRKFRLLEKFERFVSSRIKEHRYVVIGKNKSARRLAVSDVSNLQLDKFVSFKPKNFNKLFNQDGVYSVSIRVLQIFLAENALEFGVNIFGDATVRILSLTHTRGVSKVQITVDRILQPDLLFVAEGTHSTTALQLGMEARKVTNVCTDENWIFGNMTYFGEETFVISLIDVSKKTLEIANMIFNAKNHVINIAVTSDKRTSKDSIRKQILQTTQKVFNQKAFPLGGMHSKLLITVSKPVRIVNRTSHPFSIGNVFCIGDSAGSSSPLGGIGGTLGLTLVPSAIKQLLDDYERKSKHTHRNFNEYSEAYTARWIEKSESIKIFSINIFNKEHNLI